VIAKVLKVTLSLPIQHNKGGTSRVAGAAARFHSRLGHIVTATGQESSLCCASGASVDDQARALRLETELFAPPEPLARMNRLLAVAPVDLKQLEEAVKDDPQLVGEALRLCNSSLFRLPHPVARLEQAVMMMDSEITRALLLGCWVIKHSGAKIGAQDHQGFWRHSLQVAQLSRHICEWTNCGQPEWAFLAGLFHDLGALPFLTLLSRNPNGRPTSIFEEVGDSIESQRRRFGVDHCDLGVRLGSILGLPYSTVEVAGKHHQRGCASASFPLLCLVSAAEGVSQARTLSSAHASPLPERQCILNVLGEYLPGLSGAASSGLLETLESDLGATSMQFGDVAATTWEDSAASPGQR
jgi:HD-like signal output (HDOD) protein